MKTIHALHELNIPQKHRQFIVNFLKKARDINTFDRIDSFILFGSCARGEATERSDVDILAVGDGLGDETLFDLYDCAMYPGWEKDENLVDNDVFVSNRVYFDAHKNNIGSFHWRIAKDGVNLNGLLQAL
ncbi:MAG: nucleotidyltransferase domain-containing protein [Defluviitaleaceae bacterium]|nr:nucleotidyltransferase domain-containing protein [Defluviitaleaceae bacterium]